MVLHQILEILDADGTGEIDDVALCGIEIGDRVAAVALAELERVGAIAAGQTIVAGLAVEQFVTVATFEDVVALAADQGVVDIGEIDGEGLVLGCACRIGGTDGDGIGLPVFKIELGAVCDNQLSADERKAAARGADQRQG
jgi:hypothetical protein